MIPLTTHFFRGVSIRRGSSQAVHHGEEVVSFAAPAGRLVSRLGKLPHDFSQFCVGLLVLLHRVIVVNDLNDTLLVLVLVQSAYGLFAFSRLEPK